MAIVKCAECKADISSTAKICTHCGAPTPTPITTIATIAKSMIALLTLIFAYQCTVSMNEKIDGASTPAKPASIARAEAHATQPYVPHGWIYSERNDPMGRGLISIASIDSSNEVTFPFPYNKIQRADLLVQKHPEWGTHVSISLDAAQFHCRFDGCSVNVRFDDGAVSTFAAAEPADHSTDTLFLSNSGKFIAAAKKATRIQIEATFFRQGTRVFDFTTDDPLVWPPQQR